MQLMERVRSWFDPSIMEAKAQQVFRTVWTECVRAESTRHPFHREVLHDLDGLLDRVGALPADTLVGIDDILTRWQDLPRFHPSISRRLTTEWMRDFVVAEVARAARVADSTDLLARLVPQAESSLGRNELTVQHRLSGLRAIFLWRDGDDIGKVVAKSYSVDSIDPDRAWPHEGLQAVDEWEGLGITSRIYLHGASLQPDLRWGVTSLTEQSAALRARLHRGDPWRFAAANDFELHPSTACRWCVENGWADLDHAAFKTHPGVPAV